VGGPRHRYALNFLCLVIGKETRHLEVNLLYIYIDNLILHRINITTVHITTVFIIYAIVRFIRFFVFYPFLDEQEGHSLDRVSPTMTGQFQLGIPTGPPWMVHVVNP